MKNLYLLFLLSLATAGRLFAADPNVVATATTQDAVKDRFELPVGSAIAYKKFVSPCVVGNGDVLLTSLLAEIAAGTIKFYFEQACKLGEKTDLRTETISKDYLTAATNNSFVSVAIAERILSAIVYKIHLDPTWQDWKAVISNLLDTGSLPTTCDIDSKKRAALASLGCCSLLSHSMAPGSLPSAQSLAHLNNIFINNPCDLVSKSHVCSMLVAFAKGESPQTLASLISNKLNLKEKGSLDPYKDVACLKEIALELISVIRDLWVTFSQAPKSSPALKNAIAQVKDGNKGVFKQAVDTYSKLIIDHFGLPTVPTVSSDTSPVAS